MPQGALSNLFDLFPVVLMSQMELLKEIGELNEGGISVLYVDHDGKWGNEFFNDHILWDQDAKTLKHALSSPFNYEEKPLIMVDTVKNLMGFYIVGDDENGTELSK